MEVNIHEAKTHLSRLLQRVAAGEEVTIARAGAPVARLVAVEATKAPRPMGFARDEVWVADDFDAPLPDDLLAAFYGSDPPQPEKTQPTKTVAKKTKSKKTRPKETSRRRRK
jgi:prevent-host-death family protein